MTNPAADSARENARRPDGKFGKRPVAEADPFDVLPDKNGPQGCLNCGGAMAPDGYCAAGCFDDSADDDEGPSCFECGGSVGPDPAGSEGVFVHFDENGDQDFDADAQHVALPEDEGTYLGQLVTAGQHDGESSRKCWECAEDGNDTDADDGLADDNGPLCEGCYGRRVEDGLIDPDEDDMEPDDYSAESDDTVTVAEFQIPGSSSRFEVRMVPGDQDYEDDADAEYEIWRDGTYIGALDYRGAENDRAAIEAAAIRSLRGAPGMPVEPAHLERVRLLASINNPEWRTACTEYVDRYAASPEGASDYWPDWSRAHHENARNLQVGQRLATGRVVTHLDSTTSPGTVFVYTDGKIGPGQYDVWANHGDPIKVHDDRVDLSDPDWYETEAQRILAEKITEDAIVTGRPATDRDVEEWDGTIRNALYRAYSRSDISPLSPTMDRVKPNGRAKIGDDVISSSPMHPDQAYRVLGKKHVMDLKGHDGTSVVWEESDEVEYVLQNIASGQQTTSNLRGHMWRRVPAPGDNGPAARAQATPVREQYQASGIDAVRGIAARSVDEN